MGRTGAVLALMLMACGGSAPSQPQQLDSGPTDPPDAGVEEVDAGRVIPASQTFTTERGTFTGSEAFPIVSAQMLQNLPDGGAAGFLGFQLADSAQCSSATLDGGNTLPPPQVTHLLTGFVRNLDGTPVQPGSYLVGLTSARQTYAVLQELDLATGDSRSLLALSGAITVGSVDGGHLEASLDLSLGDPAAQLELPFEGSFSADVCGSP